MGYTHYFGLSKKHKKSGLNQLKEKVWKVLFEHADTIQYESDDSRLPICEVKDGEILIRFNGIEDEGHETFYFDSKDESEFCKTARKPYDLVVTKVLVLLKEFYGNRMDLGSDGFSNHQPKDRYYSVGDSARPTIIDGNWGDVIMDFNKNNDTNFKFKVIGTHGHNNCYFKVNLEKFKLETA